MSKSNKELKYRIEALEGEIEYHEERAEMQRERIWELIQENDRLTLRYEPFNPEGSEGHGESFYDLLEERNSLQQKLRFVEQQRDNLECALRNTQPAPKPKNPRKRHSAGVSLDLWPISDWFRLSFHRWNPGKYAQLTIGPIRVDFYQY